MLFWQMIIKTGTTCQEFSILENNAVVLQPLSVFTDALSGEKHLTISALHPLSRHILDMILVVLPDDCNLRKNIKETISE